MSATSQGLPADNRCANKELAAHVPAVVQEKFANDQALTLAELAVATGLPYSTVKTFASEPEFPRLGRHVFPSDFKLWRRRKTGLQSAPDTAARPQPRAAGKSGELRLKHG